MGENSVENKSNKCDAITVDKGEEHVGEENFIFGESFGWEVKKSKKRKRGLTQLKEIIAEQNKKEKVTDKSEKEPIVLSFEEAAKEVEREAEAFLAKAIKPGLQKKESIIEDDSSEASSGWEVIENSEDTKYGGRSVSGEMTQDRLESQRWVEEMNEINRKKMEMESENRDGSGNYSQSNFWRDPISDLTQLPAHPDESLPVVEQEKEKKPKGINLPISEMSYDWMNDDDAMGSFDSDDEEDIVEDKSKEPDVVKPKGISLPITEMTMDWMNDDAMGSISTDEEDTIKEAPKKLDLNLESSCSGQNLKKKEEVPAQFSPIEYWRDPIPDIVDPEEPLKNAEKSKKVEEDTKGNTKTVKVKKEKKEKNWLAANMAGMFDRKPKTKPKKEKNVELVEKNEVKIKQTTDKPQKDNIELIEKKEEIKVKDTSDKA